MVERVRAGRWGIVWLGGFFGSFDESRCGVIFEGKCTRRRWRVVREFGVVGDG